MKLDEVGNAVQPYEDQGGEDGGMQKYAFNTTNGDRYEVYFRYWMMDPADAIELFSDDKIESGLPYIEELRTASESGTFPTLDSYDLTFALVESDGEDDDVHYGIMNKPRNVVFEVFATVRAIVLDFMEKTDFDALEFSAHEKSRQNLYDHLSGLIAKHVDFHLIKGFDYSGDKVYFLFDPVALEDL